MFKAKDPDTMTRAELVHELEVLEAAVCQDGPAGQRSGSAADLALELKLFRAATPSPMR